MAEKVRIRPGRAIRRIVKVVKLADAGYSGKHHLQKGHARRVVGVPAGKAADGLIPRFAPARNGVRACARAALGASADHPLQRMGVPVHQPRQRRLPGQPAGGGGVRRLAGEPGDAAHGIGEKRETGLEFSAREHAVGQPARLGGRGGCRRRDGTGRSLGRISSQRFWRPFAFSSPSTTRPGCRSRRARTGAPPSRSA